MKFFWESVPDFIVMIAKDALPTNLCRGKAPFLHDLHKQIGIFKIIYVTA